MVFLLGLSEQQSNYFFLRKFSSINIPFIHKISSEINFELIFCTYFRIIKEEWLKDSLTVLFLIQLPTPKNSLQNRHFKKQLVNILTNYWQTQYFLCCSSGAFCSLNVPLWFCRFQCNLNLSACNDSLNCC